MRLADSGSWRLTRGADQHQHLALFARDTLALTDGADQVPRLIGNVPERWTLISDEDRPRAAQAWRLWWTAIITAPSVTAAMIEEGVAPPLAYPADPLLENAVRAVRLDAYDWFTRYEPATAFPDDDLRYWRIAKRAVDATAADLGITPGRISADLNLLLVEETWWQRFAPGRALYSWAVDADNDQLYELLRDTFASSVL